MQLINRHTHVNQSSLLDDEPPQQFAAGNAAPRILYQKDLAEALGITSSAVSRLVARGMPAHDVEAAMRWRRRNLRQRVDYAAAYAPARAATGMAGTPAGEGAQGSDAADVQTARARKEAAEAGLAELKLQRAAGELARIEDVTRACIAAAALLRSGLEGLAPALAPQLAGRKWSEAQITDLLTVEIDRLQVSLATEFAKAARAGRDMEGADDEPR